MVFTKKLFMVLLMAQLLFVFNGCTSENNKNAKLQNSTDNTSLGKGKELVLGFSQIGDESAWRTANSDSIKAAAKEAGIELIFSNAYQKTENQIDAIRSFINQRVDAIAFSPNIESGWDSVLQEAKDAGIPVFITDRSINTKDDSLYVTCIGADFEAEGKRAGEWLLDKMKDRKGEIRIYELEGTYGSAPTIGRKKGFEQVIRKNPNMKLFGFTDEDFMRSKGKEIMEDFLKPKDLKIDVLFAHNDDMALGAIDAMEEYGIKPGKDVTIVSVDAGREAFEAMIAGKLNCTVECNPLLGPQLMQTVKNYFDGKQMTKRTIVPDGIFPQETAKDLLPYRKY